MRRTKVYNSIVSTTLHASAILGLTPFVAISQVTAAAALSENDILGLRLSTDLEAVDRRSLLTLPLRNPSSSLLLKKSLQEDFRPAATQERYIDRVMFEGSALDDNISQASDKVEPALVGRRFLSADYKLYVRDTSSGGHSIEQGTGIRYRRETRDYGELYFEAELRSNQPAASDTLQAQQLRPRFTLSQYRYALTERYQMDNVLGVVRSNTNALVGSSFRIQLPSSIMQGLTSVVYDRESEWRFSSGQLGKLTGIAAQQFDATKGTLTGVGYSHRINPNWLASAQLYSLTGHDVVVDHQSVAWAAQYQSTDRLSRFKGHGLHDSKGRSGLWFDGEQRWGLLQSRYGAFRMQPDLLWTDALILADQQGAYWRSDYRTQRYTISGGADFTDNNIHKDSARGGLQIVSGFLAGFMRLDRTLTMNANTSVSRNQPKFATLGSGTNITYLANASLSKSMDIGTSRFQVSHNQTDSIINPLREDVLRWDHDWNISSTMQLSTTLAHTWNDNKGIRSTHPTLGLLFRHAVGPRFRWDGNINYNRIRDSAGRVDNNLNAALNGNWSIVRDWSAQVQLIWNRVDNTNPVAPVYTNDKTLLFTLRYETSGGTPLTQFGRSTGALGSGRITGRVFFDDNGDGIRQATEKPVAGLTVLLDGRYPVVTDNDGRFEFGPVGTGNHSISLTIERVPLPWGLLDEAPRQVNVPLRGESFIEIPLNKLNQ